MEATAIIPIGDDGYYHPSTEEELQNLVLYAYQNGQSLRVRGSSHSVTPAIYTTGYDGEGKPPTGMDVMLNRYRKVTITPDANDPSHAMVEVEAGCNLGKNPYDPTHTSTWKNSLNEQLQKAGYALDDLGGITHQTVSGFLNTGSSGGSIAYSVHDNVARLRLIDGTGTLHDLSRDDPDPHKRDMFRAAVISMGLLGVISKVFLRVGPSFNLYGSQVTSTTQDASVDLFGDGDSIKPSFADFLRNTPYTRLMWWPQHDFDRIQIWESARLTPVKGFKAQPYMELGRAPILSALAGSLFYTLIGNLDDIAAVPSKLGDWYKHLDEAIAGDPNQNACPSEVAPRSAITKEQVFDHFSKILTNALLEAVARHPEATREGSKIGGLAGKIGGFLGGLAGDIWRQIIAWIVTQVVKLILDGALESHIAQLIADVLNELMPYLIPYILDPFVPNGAQTFWDTWMCGLPMDNQMDDQLWPTDFTELWIPLDKTKDVMNALKTFYAGDGTARGAYENTGAFSCEIYASRESDLWLSPSYGADVVRIDVFWFGLNAGSPADSFYPKFWSLLEPYGFRPHWGKYLPNASADWRAYYRAQLPMIEPFLKLRKELDPKNVFLTQYWIDNLVGPENV